jgi:carbon-monoxide dehydrogenase large subunit
MQDHTSPSSLENAIALQKHGVGQPVRRKEDDTLVRGKGKYTDDFNLPGQAYAWIVRSSHAHGIIRGIDTSAAKAMPGVLGVWTGTDLAAADYGPYTCGLPLKSRDGTPLLQTNRTALMTDKVRYVGVRGRRDAGAGARCRRGRGGRYRSAAGRHRPRGSRKTRRAAAL